MSNSGPNKRDCVTTQSPQPSSTSGVKGLVVDPTKPPPRLATSSSSASSHGRMANTLSSAVEASNSQSAPLFDAVKTSPARPGGEGGGVAGIRDASSTVLPRTTKSRSGSASNQSRPVSGGGSRKNDKGVSLPRTSEVADGADEEGGGATIIRQATASSPTRTVKIPGLGSKLFKKCKSATFQIDGATYTIGKYA